MKKLIIIASLLSSSASFGHGNPIEAVDLAISAGLKKISMTESHDVIDNFQGVKSWMSGAKVKVRIYIKEMNEVNYECEMAHNKGEIERMVCN
ncbi:MAG: hypothetical protein H6625_10575 [Bdellovibrionaceae bacterium]|nr:hypothetical protein [Pseudobdellovibrionaceae bacterium]